MTFLSLTLTSFLFSNIANAFSAFKPNCTTPPYIHNYVATAQVRGTMDIVWSCFSVLILCTWSIQHLAVPLQEAPKRQSRRRRVALWAFRTFAKVFSLKHKERREILWHEFLDEVRWNFDRLEWMALCLIAPEFLLGKALQENLAANESRKMVGDEVGDEEWTTMHAFFANMRGFVMRFETTAVKMPLEFLKSDQKSELRHRDLNKPRPGGYPTPYFEQDAENAEEIERSQCKDECCNEKEAVEKRQATSPLSLIVQATVTERFSSSRDEHGENDSEQRPKMPSLDTSGLQRQDADLERSPLPATASTLVNNPQITSPFTPEDRITSPAIPNRCPQIPQIHTHSLPDLQSSLSTSPIAQLPQIPRHSPSLHSPTSVSPTGQLYRSSTCSRSVPVTPQRRPLPPHKPWPGTWPLSTIQLHYAYTANLIPAPPYLPSSHLKNQSKCDALVKALTIWQITWLVIQIIARAFQSPPLATTLLEITVCAFSACAILTYILLWHKPQDVKVPTYIDALRPITREDVIALAARAPLSTMNANAFWLHGVAVRGMGDNVFPFTRGLKVPRSISSFLTKPKDRKKPATSPHHRHHQPDEKPHTKEQEDAAEEEEEAEALYLSPVLIGIGLSGTLFGTIHFAAWSFHFPTTTERLLWRIACGFLVGLPFLMTAIYTGYTHYSRAEGSTKESRANEVLRWFGRFIIPVYLLARMYLMVEVFRSLAYSDVSAFAEVNWPSAIPHYD